VAKSTVALAVIMPLLVAVWGCKSETASPSLPPVNERLVRQVDDPKEWPFNVPQGVLRCAGNPKSPGLAAVTFIANGTAYGLNGGALTGDSYPSADPITVRNAIGLFSGNYAKYLDEGLDLCRKLAPSERPAYLPKK
jgi:hypothetical protein